MGIDRSLWFPADLLVKIDPRSRSCSECTYAVARMHYKTRIQKKKKKKKKKKNMYLYLLLY